ncbi:MAG: lmo0937 family membrane protein [Candidatus Dormibacteraceae bacterium]
MSWMVVILLVGFWVLGLLNGYSFGGLIHILLLYAGLIVIARLIERRRFFRAREHSEPVVESHLAPSER